MFNFWVIGLMFIYFIACFALIGSILLQSGKGGGLSSLASGGGTGIADALGATRAEKTLSRFTTFVAVGFMLLAILISILGKFQSTEDEALEIFPEAPAAAVAPIVPGEIPADGAAGGVNAVTIPINDLAEDLPGIISDAVSGDVTGAELPVAPVEPAEEGASAEN